MCHRVILCRKPAVRKAKPDVISARTPLLPSERAALCESCLTTGRLAEDGGAALADDNGLGVGEDGSDREAPGALHVHEEGAGGGHKGLCCPVSVIAGVGRGAMSSGLMLYACLQSYLELVLLGLSRRAGVQEIDSENLRVTTLAWLSETFNKMHLRSCRGVYPKAKPPHDVWACCSRGVGCAVRCPL